MQNILWAFVGAVVTYVGFRNSVSEIKRLRTDGHVFGEAHLTDLRSAPYVACILGAALGITAHVQFPGVLNNLILLMLVYAGLRIAFTDIDTHVVSFQFLIPSGVVALVLCVVSAIQADQSVLSIFLGMAITFTVLWCIQFASRGDLGGGDVWLGAYLGVYLGWVGLSAIYVALVCAFLVGGAVAVVLLMAGKADRRTHFPFGPCLIVGALIAVLR